MNLINDATLLKLAEAELLKEAKQAAERYSAAGISGWQPCPKPNKMFLTNTILQTMASNRLLTKKKTGKGEKEHKNRNRKLLQKNSRTDRTTNFVYQKPKNNKKSNYSLNSSKVNNSSKRHLGDKHSVNSKELIKKQSVKELN